MPRLRRLGWLSPLALLLGACLRYAPSPADFPSHESVLHGSWSLEARGLDLPARHALSNDGQALVLWSDDVRPLYRRDGAGAFTPRPSAIDFARGLRQGNLDAASGNLVIVDPYSDGGRIQVQHHPLDGGPPHLLDLEPLYSLSIWESHAFVVAGRLFLPVHESPSGARLRVHDAFDGRRLSDLALPRHDAIAVDHHQRAIAFFSFGDGLVHVVDTRTPSRYRSLPATDCRDGVNLLAGLSESGRWLVVAGCGVGARLFDLEADAPEPQFLAGVNLLAQPVFARGSDELLWYLSDVTIARLDPATGERDDIDLQGIGAPPPANRAPHSGLPPVWYADLAVLAYPTSLDRLVVVDLHEDGASTVQLLPELPPTRAELAFEAHDLGVGGLSYEVSGTMHADGRTYTLHGRVEQNIHRYQPIGELAPAVSAPRPRMTFDLQVDDGASGHAFDLAGDTYAMDDWYLTQAWLSQAGGPRLLIQLQRRTAP